MLREYGNLSSAFVPGRLPTRVRRRLRRAKVERKSQIKGRTFEVPGSGGFLLTDRVAYLEEYLTPGKEIGVFESPDDLADQVRWWLEHEDERAEAAEAGYRRVRAEHTYDHRFAEIFERVGAA
jgi:spore maturation protein CgeB